MSTYSNCLQPALQKSYNVLFGSFTRDRHAFAADENHS